MNFSAWAYRPNYLPEPLHIGMATNTDKITEPMLFYFPFGKPRTKSQLKPARFDHACRFREITRVEITSPPGDGKSEELTSALDAGLLKMRSGIEYLLEIGFDNEVQGQKKDFRPDLALIFSW